jgi:hypothetical protein
MDYTIILAVGSLRQEDPEFKISLHYIARPYFKHASPKKKK